ncbi:MAG: hypothetical protein QGF59_26305 [Pirellulaceae bacterium]|jgi:hypothetical protein|nr:hypothetical protein [Pirellulaceae bacterium]MDP6722205.1 hypothetical protein [Pirellulaceae bacterium]
MISKADPEDLAGRIRELRADPSNERIARVPLAGQVVDGYLITHNGLRVLPNDPASGGVLLHALSTTPRLEELATEDAITACTKEPPRCVCDDALADEF